MSEQPHIDRLIAATASTLQTVAPALPTLASVREVMSSANEASRRGYYLPDEDEAVRRVFSTYLTTRAALLSTLEDLRPYALEELSQPHPKRPEIFVVAYCAACLLMRSGRFLIDSFRNERVIWKKLDEAEPRFGIPKKQFTKIYRSLTSPAHIWVFLEASRYWRENKTDLVKQLGDNPIVSPVLEMLIAEEPWIETSKEYYVSRQLKYRLHSFLRRNHSGFKNVTFAIFKVSGSLISELRMRWKRKRVTPGVRRKLSKLLRPGDVIITRHDDAASNLFLPGFWPHGALYVGTETQRQGIGDELPMVESADLAADPICVLEARKDGVLFRPLSDTLSVDAVTVLRPRLTPAQIREGIERAITHEGKPYDFEFDFRRSDKLVCTEVIYRAFHGCGSIRFDLKPRMGRVCLSAEDLLDAAIDRRFFEVIAIYGVAGNRFATGERAMQLLVQSYRDPRQAAQLRNAANDDRQP